MPVKLRRQKRRRRYPDAIERLLAGEPIPDTEEARQEIILLAFCGWSQYPELGKDWEDRALDALDRWK
jgi:hypothetical protein